MCKTIKGSLTWDFTSCFFHKSVSPGPLSIRFKPFWIGSKIHEDIHNFVFIAGVVGDKLFTDVSNIGNKLSAVSLLLAIKMFDSMTPGINLSQVTTTTVIINQR